MSHLDDLRVLIELACLTEDRTDGEQRALLRIAVRCDKEANRFTVTNHRKGGAWRLHRAVEGTRRLGVGDHQVVVSPLERQRLDHKADAWDRFSVIWRTHGYTDEMRQAGV